MRWTVAAAIGMFALFGASGAQARSYDCNDPKDPPPGQWDADDATKSDLTSALTHQPFAQSQDWTFHICSMTEDGRQLLLVDAVRASGETEICDDPGNFAIVYDPRKKVFSDPIPGLKFCNAPPPVKPVDYPPPSLVIGDDLVIPATFDHPHCNAARPLNAQWSLTREDFLGTVSRVQELMPDVTTRFVTQACGVVTSDGSKLVLVDGLRLIDGERRCDDPENFAMLYNPRTRRFGPKLTPVNMCS